MKTNDEEPWGGARSEAGAPHWTDDEVNHLRVLVHDGMSDEQIAAALGRSVRGVAVKRARLGMTIRTLASPASERDLATRTMLQELQRRGFRVEGYRIYSGTDGPAT